MRTTSSRFTVVLIAALVVASLGAATTSGLPQAGPQSPAASADAASAVQDDENDNDPLRVVDIDLDQRTVAHGESVTGEVTIQNRGSEADTSDVEVTFGQFLGEEGEFPGKEEHTVFQEVSLEPGEETTFEFELSTENLPPSDAPAEYGIFAMVEEGGHMEFTSLDIVPGGDGTVHYQVDFVQGLNQNYVGPAGVNAFYGDQDRLIRYLHGSTAEAVTRGGSPGSNALADEYDDCVDSGYISANDTTASVTFTVEEGCELRLTLVAYVKPGAGFDEAYLQRSFDRSTEVFGPGTYTLTTQLPTEENYSEHA